MNYYIITYERDENKSYKKFHYYFTNSEYVIKWWHYISSCYIVGTNASMKELSKHFVRTANENNVRNRHLIMKVNLKERSGFLPEKAWDWIERNSK